MWQYIHGCSGLHMSVVEYTCGGIYMAVAMHMSMVETMCL